MYCKFYAVFILFYLRGLRSEETKTNLAQSHSVDDNPKVQQNASVKEPIKKNSGNKEENCWNTLRDLHTFEFEVCESSSLKEQLNRIRCGITNETAHYICSVSPEVDVGNYTQSNPDLCDINFKINASLVVPPTTAIFLDGWQTLPHFKCKNICQKGDKSFFKVCQFIFNYYTDRGGSMKVESLASEVKSSSVNGSPVQPLADTRPLNVEDRLPPKDETVIQEKSEPVADYPDSNLGNQRKKVVDEQHENINDQNSVAGKDDTLKAELTVDENEKEHKNIRISEDGGFSLSSKDNIAFGKIDNDGESHAFFYFALVSGICIAFYLMMYNKKKLLALMIEGRRRNVKRRPNSAAYSKLDCNLEEAMASGPSTSTSNTLLY